MRTATKAQLFTPSSGLGVIDDVVAVIRDWINDKYTYRSGSYTVKKSGERALVVPPEIFLSSMGRKLVFRTSEVIPGGELKTNLRAIEENGRTWLLFQLSVGTGTGLVSPMSANIRLSRYWKSIIDLDYEWQVVPESDRVFSQEFKVTEENLDQFRSLLTSPARRLPITAISESIDSDLPIDAPSRFASLFKGLTHVCVLDEGAAWRITEDLGREWSCFNGAARIYWPLHAGLSEPYRHPLFTQAILSAKAERISPYRVLENALAKHIFEASCYLSEGRIFADFEKAELNEQIADARNLANKTQDYSELEELYAKENDRLAEKSVQLQEENESLRRENEQLLIAMRSTLGENNLEIGDPAEKVVPQSLIEAINVASKRFEGIIVFGDKVLEQVQSARPNAGPPDKVLRFLEELANLSIEYGKRRGSLGQTVIQWLKSRSVECSGESETKKGAGLYQWPVDGNQTEFDLHLKPNEATSPDRCIRIYFHVRKEEPCVLIGFIGTKLELGR